MLKPSQPGREIMAFIGGSFRPPNKRHWQMIQYYSDLVGSNGEVIVVVSNPKSEKSQHRMEDGRPVTTAEAVEVLEIFRDKDHRNNVTIMDSDEPSPVTVIRGLISDPDAISDVDVLIGCYKSDEDIKKWNNLKTKIEEANPSITFLDFERYAMRRSYENYAHGISKLQRRTGGISYVDEADALPEFLSDKDKENILNIIYHGEAIRNGRYNDVDDVTDEKITESSGHKVLKYNTYQEFVDEWIDSDPLNNIFGNSKIKNDVLEIEVNQPRKEQTLTLEIKGYDGSSDWKKDINYHDPEPEDIKTPAVEDQPIPKNKRKTISSRKIAPDGSISYTITYKSYQEFVDDWSGSDPRYNVFETYKVDGGKLKITVHQPRKDAEITIVVEDYAGTEDSWRKDLNID